MVAIDADRAGLVVIDLQRAFCAAGGSVSRQGRDVQACAAVLPACAAIVEAFRDRRRPVIWTRMGFSPDYRDGGILVHELRPGIAAVGGLQRGTTDTDLMLAPREDEPVLEKTRFSAFHGTALWDLVEHHEIRDIVLVGVTTSMCVETTAREASQHDLRVVVPRDAVADLDHHVHAASLDRIAYGFGHVVDNDDVLAAVVPAAPPSDETVA